MTNHFQEEWDNGRIVTKEPTTSTMAQRIQEDWALANLNRSKPP